MNQVNFTSNDVGTDMIDIGFVFPFYGQEYSDFLINRNGWIGFENDNTDKTAINKPNIPKVKKSVPPLFQYL